MQTIGALRVELSATLQSYLSRLALLHYGSLDHEYADMLRKLGFGVQWNGKPC